MGVEAYMGGLEGGGDKGWGEEIEECGGMVCVVVEEKKEERLKEKNG